MVVMGAGLGLAYAYPNNVNAVYGPVPRATREAHQSGHAALAGV